MLGGTGAGTGAALRSFVRRPGCGTNTTMGIKTTDMVTRTSTSPRCAHKNHPVNSRVNTLPVKLGKEAARITWVGVGANIALTVTKGIAGVLCNSASLIADAGHSASDLVSDGMTLLAVRFARRPPTEAFPYGLGRAEVGTE